MRIERVQHAVAGRVLDVPQVHVRPAEAVLHEGEGVAEVGAHVPRADDVIDAELLLLGVDSDLHLRGVVLFAGDDDLRHVLLDVVEGRQEHLLRLHSLGVDVPIADRLEDFVDDFELREVVGSRLLIDHRGVAGGDRGREALPESTAVQLDRQKAGDSECTDESTDLRDLFENAHRVEV